MGNKKTEEKHNKIYKQDFALKSMQLRKKEMVNDTIRSKFLPSKKGQLTIFIIIAIVIVAVLVVLFYPRLKVVLTPTTPGMQLQNCIDKKLGEGIALIEKQGGSIQPVHAISFQGNSIEYLCYTNQFYKTCVMQQPMLKQHIEREIVSYIKQDADACFNDLTTELVKKGYAVNVGKTDVSVEILPENVKVTFGGAISITKEAIGEGYNKFELSKRSKLYDLVMISTSILNWEARYGDSDPLSYMLYYPNLKIQKLKQSDGSKIYILSDVNTKEGFTFATRSLSWPAGYNNL